MATEIVIATNFSELLHDILGDDSIVENLMIRSKDGKCSTGVLTTL